MLNKTRIKMKEIITKVLTDKSARTSDSLTKVVRETPVAMPWSN
jgi:hypothetical protein